MHTAVLSGSKGVDPAVTDAQNRAKNEILGK